MRRVPIPGSSGQKGLNHGSLCVDPDPLLVTTSRIGLGKVSLEASSLRTPFQRHFEGRGLWILCGKSCLLAFGIAF
eukprot:1141369-Amorphochlora_amoeboformis.AAC.1